MVKITLNGVEYPPSPAPASVTPVAVAAVPDGRRTRRKGAGVGGFTLIELVVAVCIVGILAAIAYPSYINNVTKTRRSAAAACLSGFATQMERFYTTNLRYDEDGDDNPMNTAALVAMGLDCASNQNTGEYYSYRFAAEQPTRTTYVIEAAPSGIQAERDAGCGTLSISNTGARNVGGTSGVDKCW